MPEKPEVVTVARSLEKRLIGLSFTECKVYWNNIIEGIDVKEFEKNVLNQTIKKITTRGKWILISMEKDTLLVHLRMEGKFFFRETNMPKEKHEHVIFTLSNGLSFRFHDVRKFGKMHLISNEQLYQTEPLNQLGYEYNDSNLTGNYLKNAFKMKQLPIKSVLLDQRIIAGIGNIYDDEILFLSKISPFRSAKSITLKECDLIIENTKLVLDKAIEKGGTTIKSFTSEEGVHGLFQNELQVHGKLNDICPICGNKIKKVFIGGRGTYYCSSCQK